MISGRTLAIVVAVLAAVLTLVFWPKKAASAEDQIRALVARCVRSAEDKDLSVIADAMAPEFQGPRGASRDEVKGTIAFQVLRGGEATTVFNPSLSVTVLSPTSGEFTGKFVFARGKDGAAMSAYQIDAKVEKRDGKWLFVSATYREL